MGYSLKNMNKYKFIEVTGQDPEEMFGENWEVELLALNEDFDFDKEEMEFGNPYNSNEY